MPTTDPLTPAQLAEWRTITDAATPGPWDYDGMHNEITAPYSDSGYWIIVSECRATPDSPPQDCNDKDVPDFVFVATARTAMPALIAEVERLRAQNAAMREMLKAVEYGGMDGTVFHCPCCLGKHTTGHAPDCALAKMLKEAE